MASPDSASPVNLLSRPRGRHLMLGLLYLSEGAPMGFIWWALPTLLSRAGVDLGTITTLTATATLPWILKFLAGPVIDASVLRGTGLRHWIIACQLLMGLALLPLAWIDWPTALPLLTVLVLMHATAAATQDVAIDTLAMRSVPAAELGRANGWMQAGMLLGRAGVAGLALTVSATLGQGLMVGVIILLIWAPGVILMLATREPPEPHGQVPAPRAWLKAIAAPGMLAGIWIALTAAAGFEFLGVAAGPLLTDRGVSDGPVAGFFGLVAPIALALGALVGGRLADRYGAREMTLISIFVVGVLAAGLGGLLSGAAAGDVVWLTALGIVYAGAGCLTASSYALFMTLARGRLAATRFSVLMAMTNAGEAWSGFAGGRLQPVAGYGGALIVMALLSTLALPALQKLKKMENRFDD